MTADAAAFCQLLIKYSTNFNWILFMYNHHEPPKEVQFIIAPLQPGWIHCFAKIWVNIQWRRAGRNIRVMNNMMGFFKVFKNQKWFWKKAWKQEELLSKYFISKRVLVPLLFYSLNLYPSCYRIEQDKIERSISTFLLNFRYLKIYFKNKWIVYNKRK